MFASLPSFAIAHGLRGFRSSSLRVQVTEIRDGYAWVRTADLLDAGTPLVLDASQVEAEPGMESGLRHTAGMVAFA